MKNRSQIQETEQEFLEATIQHLYGLGLRLESCLHLLEEYDAAHREVVDSAINGLGDLIDGMRTRIEALDL